jgi:error-prone DNA polymerase
MRNLKALRFAHELRAEMTPCERRLWRALRGRRLAGWKFRRQADLGPFIIDFLCFDPPLVVEIDGRSHDTFDRARLDASRDAYCRWRGFTVLRFSNEDVRTNLAGVVEAIWIAGLALRGERPYESLIPTPPPAPTEAAPLLLPPQAGGEAITRRRRRRGTLGVSPPAERGEIKRGAVVTPAYAELISATNFSFLEGGSHADEMVLQAKALGIAALGVCDRNTLAGVVRAHAAAKKAGLKLLVGARIATDESAHGEQRWIKPRRVDAKPSALPFEVAVYPRDRAAYARLTRLLTLGRRRAPKGECALARADLIAHAQGQELILLPPEDWTDAAWRTGARELAAAAPEPDAVHLALVRRFDGRDGERLHALAVFAAELGVATVATADALYHHPDRRPLADVLACIRGKTTLDAAGFILARNAERHLKPAAEQARLFKGYEDAVARTAAVAARIGFSLDEIAFQYPDEVIGEGETAMETLVRLTWAGAATRYPEGVPDPVRSVLEHELKLIGELDYAPYFLTVHDLVRFARSQGILCQGRGSSANSAVCFCLAITSVDPAKLDLLFERFISAERGEPPDIDVDFEHDRREEVIQYVYEKYGRARAGLAATVISYRARSAIREVGKALGLTQDVLDALAKTVWGWSEDGVEEAHVREELGFDPEAPRLRLALALARELIGFPRHLSQHVGGFVITRDRLDDIVPVENAAMEDRTVVEWDKDDLEELRILKVDVLGLGMLTAIAHAFDMLGESYGVGRETAAFGFEEETPPAAFGDVAPAPLLVSPRCTGGETLTTSPPACGGSKRGARAPHRLDLADILQGDAAVYDMICKADTVGVFQIESRAQMSMLPRLRPRNFYDLVIEVAIVRPGPIQGDMVHPYLRRRDGIEQVSYPSKALEKVLGKTLGVPLFQEQAMKIAIVAAGFTPAEADRLRRAMATFKKTGIIHEFGARLVDGMVANGYERDFAERCFKQIEGFGEYGFPESHAASFASLVYVSAWLKHHYPDVFLAAILNAQPMGFYAPAQLVRDARSHGVDVRAPDVNLSDWDSVLEEKTLADVGDAGSAAAPLLLPPQAGGEVASVSPPVQRGEIKRGAATENLTHPRGNALAVRLGLRLIKGLNEAEAAKIVAARAAGGPFADPEDLLRRARIRRETLARLAEADAFRSAGQDRRAALWAAKAVAGPPTPLFAAAGEAGAEAPAALPAMPLCEHVAHDYQHLRLSLKAHPVSFFRERLTAERARTCADAMAARGGTRLAAAGLVLVRQRPGTAKGVVFVTLEDETGVANLVVWRKTFERYRKAIMGARLLRAWGKIQREGEVVHLVVEGVADQSARLAELADGEDCITDVSARVDEVRRLGRDPRDVGASKAREAAERAARIVYPSRDFH